MYARSAFLLGLVLASPALSQEIGTVGKPAPDYTFTSDNNNSGKQRVFSLRKRMMGRITVIYYFRLPNVASVEMLERMGDINREYKKMGVRLMLICSDKSENVKKALEEIEMPDEYFLFYGPAFRLMAESFGIMAAPGVCIIDGWGKIVWRGSPDDPLGSLEERLDDLIERTNPLGADARWISQQMREAQDLREQGEYGKAYSAAQRVKRMTDSSGEEDEDEDENNQGRSGEDDIGGYQNSSDYEKARAFQSELETKADAWISEAIEAERKDDFEKAAYIVSEIAVRFGKSDVKRKAENEIGRMNGNRKIKDLIRTARNNALAMMHVEDAQFLIEHEQFEDARAVLREVIKDYEDTDGAKLAKKELEKFENDPARMNAVAHARADRDAEHLLSIGDHFFRSEMYKQARASYEQLVKDYPKSTYVQTAKERMKKLPKESAQAEKP